jgi:AraC-like DNA-binding protein
MDDRLLAVTLAAWIEEHLTEAPTGKELIGLSGYSENRLRQKFYNVTGETPSSYMRKRRLTEAARQIMAGRPIVEAALAYGYSSQDNFTTAFKTWCGLTPGELASMDGAHRGLIAMLKEPLNIMEITNLTQPSYSATLLGCVKGAADFFDLDYQAPALYALTGHAFLVNIHEALCPSGPYVWDHSRFFDRLARLGVRKTGDVELRKGAAAAEIRAAEDRLKAHLDAGNLCILDYLEHQLVSGYDEKGLILIRPWGGKSGAELPALSFGTWEETLGAEGWACFTLLEKGPVPGNVLDELPGALDLALDLHARGSELQVPGYSVGRGAWKAWIKAVEAGGGTGHGHWWNGMVWSECRAMAAWFFEGVGPLLGSAERASLCGELRTKYRTIADLIGRAKEKDLPMREQVDALSKAAALEEECQPLLERLRARLPA